MRSLKVNTNQGTYPIEIGMNGLNKLIPYVNQATQVVVITDETVEKLHYKTLKAFLPSQTLRYVIKPGEASKSFSSIIAFRPF